MSKPYIQMAVLPVPTANKQSYVDHATQMAAIFRELGAEISLECWGTDIPEGKTTDFRKAVAAKADESIVCAMMRWPSKEVADQAMMAMRSDPRMAGMQMPFDGSRMIFGGFESLDIGQNSN